jgi:hypothetical protein
MAKQPNKVPGSVNGFVLLLLLCAFIGLAVWLWSRPGEVSEALSWKRHIFSYLVFFPLVLLAAVAIAGTCLNWWSGKNGDDSTA